MPRSRPPPPLQVAEDAASAGSLYLKKAGVRARSMSGYLYDKPIHVDRLLTDLARFERNGLLHTVRGPPPSLFFVVLGTR
jgi:hypothetical protein